MDGVEARLKCPDTDYLDLYHVHASDQCARIDQTFRSFDELARHGCIRGFSLANWATSEIRHAIRVADHYGLPRPVTLETECPTSVRDIEYEIDQMLFAESVRLVVRRLIAGILPAVKFDNDQGDGFDHGLLLNDLQRTHRRLPFFTMDAVRVVMQTPGRLDCPDCPCLRTRCAIRQFRYRRRESFG